MDEKTTHAEGVVLRTVDFGDAHRVVTIFTKEFGKLDVNAYGCRRPRSKLAAPTMMFNHIGVELLHGPKVDMIRDAEIINYFPITDDLLRLAYASFFFETVNQMTPLNLKDEDIFFLLLKSLKTFVERNPRVVAVIAACQFISISGVMLRLDRCVRCGVAIDHDCVVDVRDGGALCRQCSDGAVDVLPLTLAARSLADSLLTFDWDEQSHLIVRAEPLRDLEKILVAHIQSLIERPLQSIKFLRRLRSVPASA